MTSSLSTAHADEAIAAESVQVAEAIQHSRAEQRHQQGDQQQGAHRSSAMAEAEDAHISDGSQSQMQPQQQPQPLQPLLDWKLTFRQRDLELSYWQCSCQQKLLMLDRMVMFLNLLVLLNVASSRLGRVDFAVHAVSLALLAAQAMVMACGVKRYVRVRPLIMLLQRLWRALLRLQHLLPAVSARVAVGSAAAAATVDMGSRVGACTASSAAPTVADVAGSTSGEVESPLHMFIDAAVINSGVVPSWAYAWAYRAPVGTAPVLQSLCLLFAVLADTARLLQRISAPQLQLYVAACYNACAAACNLVLLPLLPQVAMPAPNACPAVPALPLLLWLQLFWGIGVPGYVLFYYEQASKVRFWLQRLAAQPEVADEVARAAQEALRKVQPPYAYLRHAVTLLLLAALAWQACDLLYWYMPDTWLQQLLPRACPQQQYSG